MACTGLLVVSVGAVVALNASASGNPNATTDWTVYHGDYLSSGSSGALGAIDTGRRAWTSPSLDGELYGEPLVFGGEVYVATEDDTIYALSAKNGAVVWSRHLATPVPSSMLPCGDITPTVGITGTPVIDPSRGEIFAVADELVGGGPEHFLVGLSITNGALELRERVDPPGADPAALLQRTGLTLDAGRVIFGMGGNYGDCSTYRGRVIAVNERGSTPTIFTVDDLAGDSQGAVWMGGAAPVVDASGDVWVATGNGSVHSSGQPYDDSDGILELSAGLRLRQFFAPSDWPANNAADLDMSTSPALLSNGQALLVGKSGIAYLLAQSHLGGIGHQETYVGNLCSNDVDGGIAIDGGVVFLPCLNGPVALRVGATPPSLRVLWTSNVGGGPPILAANIVWTIGQNGALYGLNPASGAVERQVNVGVPANHFPTPSVGDALLLVPSATRVVAFPATPAG